MSVFRRKTSAGKTAEFHYKFMQGGKTFFGVCENCLDEDTAKAFEKKQRQITKELSTQKNVKALVENFRDELSGGVKIPLDTAFEESLKKPRRHKSSERHTGVKRSQFGDFVDYMKYSYPDIQNISDIQQRHADGYIQHLRTNGKFNKNVTFSNTMKEGVESNYSRKEKNLSPRTINAYHKTISEVFKLVSEDSGLQENPFKKIPLLREEKESREAFSASELELITHKATPFVKPIFILGLFTALREGDIATLLWKEINIPNRIIRRKLLKTGAIVEIPIMQPLFDFLQEQYSKTGENKYVLPEHAEMYQKNPSGISRRVKNFLEGIGIKTTKKVKGRDRAVSIKDVHSLRHTFCYFAGISGIPLVIVQSIVGHMTPEMTAHYTAHADLEAKREKMLLLPNLVKQLPERSGEDGVLEKKRKELLEHLALANSSEIERFYTLLNED